MQPFKGFHKCARYSLSIHCRSSKAGTRESNGGGSIPTMRVVGSFSEEVGV